MEYMRKIAGNSDRKGVIMELLSQMGAHFTVQQFVDVENVVVSLNPIPLKRFPVLPLPQGFGHIVGVAI